jgi:hypothetical protein
MPFESGSGHSRRALSVAYQGTAVITAWDIGRHQLRTADHIAMSTAEVPSAADIIGRHGHLVNIRSVDVCSCMLRASILPHVLRPQFVHGVLDAPTDCIGN